MTLNISAPTTPAELKPRIIVFGVGGAGCNAVNNMLRSSIEGVECVVANTDSQALMLSAAPVRLRCPPGRSATGRAVGRRTGRSR